jgi:hypothetical protein
VSLATLIRTSICNAIKVCYGPGFWIYIIGPHSYMFLYSPRSSGLHRSISSWQSLHTPSPPHRQVTSLCGHSSVTFSSCWLWPRSQIGTGPRFYSSLSVVSVSGRLK